MANELLATAAREALARAGLTITQVADQMDVNYVTIWKLVHGRSVSPHTLSRFAEVVGEPPLRWIALSHPELAGAVRQGEEGEGVGYIPRPSSSRLPVVGTLRGGAITEPQESLEGEFFPCLPEHAALADYVVRVQGDSLYPLILEGDYVAVRKTQTAQPGQIIVARLGDEVVMKRYGGRKGGVIQLESVNPVYPPIQADEKIEILGVVAWTHRTDEIMRKFGR